MFNFLGAYQSWFLWKLVENWLIIEAEILRFQKAVTKTEKNMACYRGDLIRKQCIADEVEKIHSAESVSRMKMIY